jgi:hypothetical protein
MHRRVVEAVEDGLERKALQAHDEGEQDRKDLHAPRPDRQQRIEHGTGETSDRSTTLDGNGGAPL